MRKLVEILSISLLFCFSFLVTEKTMSVVKEEDEIMIMIKKEHSKYNQNSIDATIDKKTIRPGISGHKVNINKSYKAMREYGKYNEDLYVYDYIKPKISIDNNKDKIIIGGNKKYRKVTIIISLDDNSNIDNMISILNNNKTKINFFVTDNWLLENNNLAISLMKQDYVFGISKLMNYHSNKVKWMDALIKRVGKQSNGYFLYKSKKDIEYAYKLNDYTIKPIYISNNYLLNIQDNISNGNIYLFNYSKTLEDEIPSIIRYINSKGYDIVTLNDVLKE